MGGRRLRPLPREFYDRPVLEVARDLLGAEVWRGDVAVRVSEVEAYEGAVDEASHAFRGRTARNAVMFGPPGHLYVYFTYGMHFCMNLVCAAPGRAAAVLVRAGEVVAGEAEAAQRRPRSTTRDLARGPARLCQALGIDGTQNGVDVTQPDAPVRVVAGTAVPDARVRRGPRVGISRATDLPWRLWVEGDRTVSAYRPHVPRRARSGGDPAADGRRP